MAVDIPFFKPNTNLVMACHITGIHDVNRNMTLADDDYNLVKDWADSITAANLQGVIFHNNFTVETCKRHENDNISFVKINYNPQFNPNVYRYFIYKDFLQKQINQLNAVFVTDITDVVLVSNPFTSPYFEEKPTSLFCGDEPKILNNEWMIAHSENLRTNISDYSDYEKKYGHEILLNCGIIGGKADLLFDFIEKLCQIHEEANSENKTEYTGDMGAFNYLVRTQFNKFLKHGAPVNTQFKIYETTRNDCWFRHK
jgi:hypothetical protein